MNEDVIRKIDVSDRIDTGVINRSLEDVAEEFELTSHPIQEIVTNSKFVQRARRYVSFFDFHI
jgi:hypothetical protein